MAKTNSKVIEKVTEEEKNLEIEEIETKKPKKKGKKETYVIPRYNPKIAEGLTEEQIAERIEHGILNVSSIEHGKSVLSIIITNIFTFFNLLYFIITVLLIMAKEYKNLLFLAIIIPNIIIGLVQELKAKSTIKKLSLVSSPTAVVIRGGKEIEIPVEEVVLDDIIYLKNGKQICADSVVLDGQIEANESLLTGESDAIVKKKGDLLLSGSFVVSGACHARVDKVGKDNYLEKLSKDAKQYRKPRSELMRSLKITIKVIAVLIVILIYPMYLTNSSGGADFSSIVTSTAGSVIGMIPAGLFLLTSVALAVGVIRLAKNNTLVQELYGIEMLARVDVLCLDKTGTITDGTMRVCDCIEIKNETEYTVREIIGSMMNAFQDRNPTSEALIKYFDINKVLKPKEIVPFSSQRKYSAVRFEKTGTFIIGAPEIVLVDQYPRVRNRVNKFAAQGCRVLVLAQAGSSVKEKIPNNAKAIALIVIQDHIREDAIDTIQYFKNNGVDVKVISGDNPTTVSEIAMRVGIPGAERCISLDGKSDEEVKSLALDYTVFGRVAPDQKRLLVQTLKEHKKTVAMTGDGVNDILALKEADCSIAMASGSEATRLVSHLVLMDSNFASMPKVVNEGRRVINNIERTSTLFLVKTLFSILLTILYIALSKPYPFQPKDLAMVEYFCIGIPAFFLSLQPNNEKVKGRFILNVLRNSIPGALTVLSFHLILNFINQIFNILPASMQVIQMSPDEFRVIIILVTTFVTGLVLYEVCKPYNWFRTLLFLTMILFCCLYLLIFSGLMNIPLELLSLQSILLMIIMVLIAHPIMKGIRYLFNKI